MSWSSSRGGCVLAALLVTVRPLRGKTKCRRTASMSHATADPFARISPLWLEPSSVARKDEKWCCSRPARAAAPALRLDLGGGLPRVGAGVRRPETPRDDDLDPWIPWPLPGALTPTNTSGASPAAT